MLVGYSTGAFPELREEFSLVIPHAKSLSRQAIELNASSFQRLEDLSSYLHDTPESLGGFEYISVHAPATSSDWELTMKQLYDVGAQSILFHADTLPPRSLLLELGTRAAIENMDHLKADGRTLQEMSIVMDQFPDAQIVIDVAHAHQIDSSDRLLRGLVGRFSDRIAHYHLSKLDSQAGHLPLNQQDLQWLETLPIRNAPWIWEECPFVSNQFLASYLKQLQQESLAANNI